MMQSKGEFSLVSSYDYICINRFVFFTISQWEIWNLRFEIWVERLSKTKRVWKDFFLIFKRIVMLCNLYNLMCDFHYAMITINFKQIYFKLNEHCMKISKTISPRLNINYKWKTTIYCKEIMWQMYEFKKLH